MPTPSHRIVPVVRPAARLHVRSLAPRRTGAGSASTGNSREPRRQPDQPRPQPGGAATRKPRAHRRKQKPQAQTARGELSSIDATAKMLTIKPTEGAEQKFQYNDDDQGDRRPRRRRRAGYAEWQAGRRALHLTGCQSRRNGDRSPGRQETSNGAHARSSGARGGPLDVPDSVFSVNLMEVTS